MIDKKNILKKKKGRNKFHNKIEDFIKYSIERIIKSKCINVDFTISNENNIIFFLDNGEKYKVFYTSIDKRFKNKIRRKLRQINKKHCP